MHAVKRLSVQLLLWFGLCAVPFAATAAEPLEASVKAAYLAKFAFYVDWPPAAFSAPTAPVVVCIVGDDAFGALVEEAATGQTVQGHGIAVKRLKSVARDSGCHIAYVGAEAKLDVLKGSPVLVVTDGQGGNGMINFVLRDNRVRFTVDDDLAAQFGLGISSKLLNVALAVKPRGAR
jgi:YfiR/HmsC-like